MPSKLSLRPGVVALSIVSLLACPHARAQASAAHEESSGLERARTLFLEARAHIGAGRFSEACESFEESLRLEVGVGTKYNLADCWERIGRTASAQALFLGVAAEAQLNGEPERARVASARAAALESRIPKLAIDVEPMPGLSVRLDRVILEESAYGMPQRVDPGPHRIEARGGEGFRWTKSIEVPAEGTLVTVTIPALPKPAEEPRETPGEPKAPPRSPSLSGKSSRLAALDEPSPPPRSSGIGKSIAIGRGALGVGGLTVGGYYTLKYRDRDREARSICADGGTCTKGDVARHEKLVKLSRKASTRAFIGAGSGLAVLTGAALLYFTSDSKPDAPRVGALVLPDGSWGISTEGTF